LLAGDISRQTHDTILKQLQDPQLSGVALNRLDKPVRSNVIAGLILGSPEFQRRSFMSITRRVFMRNGAMAVVGTAAIPAFLSRAVYAADSLTGGKKRMVVIFQRGAADGLNIVVPHAESSYYSMRPTIAIPRQNVIDLDGFFGLHPSMAA